MGIWYYPEDEFNNNVGIDMSQITIHSLKTNVSVIKLRLLSVSALGETATERKLETVKVKEAIEDDSLLRCSALLSF
jgi:hypothetical protein